MSAPSRPPSARSGEGCVVGVDGGGTGSRALVVDSSGREVARAEGPPALVQASDPGAAAFAMAQTVEEALARGGIEPPVAALWTGLAGAGRSGGREAVEIALRSRKLAVRTRVGLDVEGAHWDAFGPEPGVLLSVGTGTVVWGRSPEGREIKVGGWGHPLGEEGSGYWLGLRGLQAVVQAADGRIPPTSLSRRLPRALGIPEVQDLVPWIDEATKGEVAALAPAVLDAAAQGDPAARDIIADGLESLSRHMAVVRRLWLPEDSVFPLALAGGLLRPGAHLREAVARVARSMGGQVLPGEVVAVRGASRLALRLLDPPGPNPLPN